MNAAHWHLMINHIPVIATPFVLVVWTLALIKNQADWYRFAWGSMIVIGLITIAVYLTGQNAHGLLHGMPGVLLSQIDVHEQWASYTLIAIEVTAILSVIGFWVSKTHSPARLFKWATSVILVIAAGLSGYTAHVGGQIHHPEMCPGFVPVEVEPGHHHQSKQEESTQIPQEVQTSHNHTDHHEAGNHHH